VLVYSSSIDLPSRTLRYLTGQLASRRQEIGKRWRRLTAGSQALLALAHCDAIMDRAARLTDPAVPIRPGRGVGWIQYAAWPAGSPGVTSPLS
jgi:hypothetical protein